MIFLDYYDAHVDNIHFLQQTIMYGGYTGLGSMGNSFSGLGSYGGLTRNYGPGYAANDPQRQNNQQQDPEKNTRKIIFEEWFKMMGGLKSIVQIGLAAIAIANFYSHLSAMATKVAGIVKSMLGGLLNILNKRIASKMVSKLSNPETRIKTIKNFALNFVRLFSVLLLCLAAKLKTEIKRDSEEKLKRLEEEYQRCKNGGFQLQEIPQGAQHRQEVEVIVNANL